MAIIINKCFLCEILVSARNLSKITDTFKLYCKGQHDIEKSNSYTRHLNAMNEISNLTNYGKSFDIIYLDFMNGFDSVWKLFVPSLQITLTTTSLYFITNKSITSKLKMNSMKLLNAIPIYIHSFFLPTAFWDFLPLLKRKSQLIR